MYPCKVAKCKIVPPYKYQKKTCKTQQKRLMCFFCATPLAFHNFSFTMAHFFPKGISTQLSNACHLLSLAFFSGRSCIKASSLSPSLYSRMIPFPNFSMATATRCRRICMGISKTCGPLLSWMLTPSKTFTLKKNWEWVVVPFFGWIPAQNCWRIPEN